MTKQEINQALEKQLQRLAERRNRNEQICIRTAKGSRPYPHQQ